jgi:endoglucanase
MDSAGRAERYDCLNYGVDKLTAAGALVYLDAADSGWSNPTTMSEALLKAGVLRARGFSTNVAHHRTTKNEHIYATAICEKIQVAHGVKLKYLIDTGRNGNGPYDLKPGQSSQVAWCNNPRAGIGPRPTLKLSTVAYPYCDGLVHVKGLSSDGSREGAPSAGSNYPENALRLYWQANPKFPAIDF